MLFDLVAWILITFICYGWGGLFYSLIARGQHPRQNALPLYCMTGVVIAGVAGYYLSLAGPLHPAFRLLFFLVPVGRIFFPAARRKVVADGKQAMTLFTGRGWALTVACIITVLIIAASPVIHPDTLNYHQFSVRIFQDYGFLYGIVNTRVDLGFQSIWFAALNLFEPGMAGGGIAFPLAGAAMLWFILFLRQEERKPGQQAYQWQWYAFLLLLFTMASWTQIRLTAASASPDFITAILVMAAFYFFTAGPAAGKSGEWLAVFFSVAATLTKLSAFPVLIIPVLIFFEQCRFKNWRKAFGLAVLGAVMLLPLLMRSYLESGYLLYPSIQLNFFHPDWKMPEDQAFLAQEYIRAYARYPITSAETFRYLALPFPFWTNLWWRHLYLADKLLLILVAAGMVSIPLFFRRYRKTLSGREWNGLLAALAGVIFWFVFGPDPRFGSGFLLAFVALAALPFVKGNEGLAENKSKIVYAFSRGLLLLAVTGYAGFRLVHFVAPGAWKMPAGIVNTAPVAPDCTDLVKKLLFPDLPYGGPLPDSCRSFRFRGKGVADGFAPLAP